VLVGHGYSPLDGLANLYLASDHGMQYLRPTALFA
jgi:hypothetical protein